MAEEILLLDVRQVPDVRKYDHPAVGKTRRELGGHAWRIDQVEFTHEHKAGHLDRMILVLASCSAAAWACLPKASGSCGQGFCSANRIRPSIWLLW